MLISPYISCRSSLSPLRHTRFYNRAVHLDVFQQVEDLQFILNHLRTANDFSSEDFHVRNTLRGLGVDRTRTRTLAFRMLVRNANRTATGTALFFNTSNDIATAEYGSRQTGI